MVRGTHLASPNDVLIYVLFVHTKEKHWAYIVYHFFLELYHMGYSWKYVSHQPNVEQEKNEVIVLIVLFKYIVIYIECAQNHFPKKLIGGVCLD